MRRVFGGAALVIAGISAFIETHAHRPMHSGLPIRLLSGESAPPELSTTAYELLRIGAWALVIIGALLIIMGLMSYWADQRVRAAKA